MYIYDADQHRYADAGTNYGAGSGYFANENYSLEPIISTPNNTHLLPDGTAKRKSQFITDAKWIVNGIVDVKNGAGLYTTASGAQIESTQKGQVSFATSLGTTNTYQAKYKGGGASALVNTGNLLDPIRKEGVHERIPFVINSARLLNANGDYVSTMANTFYYNPEKGEWLDTC